jgi:hypothetical protein
MTNAKFLKLITSATGTDWVAPASTSNITVLHVINNTGSTWEFRRSGDTVATFQLPDGLAYSFRGLSNSNQLEFRRADTSGTQLTAFAEAELEHDQK